MDNLISIPQLYCPICRAAILTGLEHDRDIDGTELSDYVLLSRHPHIPSCLNSEKVYRTPVVSIEVESIEIEEG